MRADPHPEPLFAPVAAAASESRTSLLRRGENCCADTRSDRVAFLVDAEAYYGAFLLAAERAERSILIVGWDFDSRTPLGFDAAGAPSTTLGAFLNRLVRRRGGLQVHVLDWDFPMIFGRDREFPPLYGLNWRPHRRVHLRFDDTHPVAGSHHQKIVVIDDRVAFVGGLDLTSRRWDTPAHHPDDPRRVASGQRYPPFHDMMIMVDGDAARALGGSRATAGASPRVSGFLRRSLPMIRGRRTSRPMWPTYRSEYRARRPR